MKLQSAPEHKLSETIKLFERGDLKNASRKASVLRKKYPRCFNSANVYAACMMTANKLVEAVSAYEHTVSLKPSYAAGYFNIGVCSQDTNRFSKAIKNYTCALEIDPNFYDAAFNRGSVKKSMGNFNEALSDLAYVHSMIPSRQDYAWSYGDCLERLGLYEDALNVFQNYEHREMEHRTIGSLFASGQHDAAVEKLNFLAKRDAERGDLIIPHAAISAFVSDQLDVPNPYPFCDPMLNFIKVQNIASRPAFEGNDVDEFLTKITKELKVLEAFSFTHTATKGGEQTNSVVFDSRSPRMAVLKDIIEKAVFEYREEFAARSDQPFIRNWPSKATQEGWFVSVRQGGYQEMHTHNTAWLSGVLYLQVVTNPKDSEGAIRFSLDSGKYPTLAKECDTVVHQPNVGDLVLFPSSLFHGTNPVLQDAERCCIAFDVLPARANSKKEQH